MKKVTLTAAILLLTLSTIVIPAFAWGYYAIVQGVGSVWDSSGEIVAMDTMTLKYKSEDFSGMEKIVLRYPDWENWTEEWVWEVTDSWLREWTGATVLMCEPATTGPNPGEGWLRVVWRKGLGVGNTVVVVGENVAFIGTITMLPYSD